MLVESVVFEWYTGATGSLLTSRDSPVLADDSFVLEIEDLCHVLCGVIDAKEVQKMRVLSQIVHTVVQKLERKGGNAPLDFSALSLTKPKTIFGLEFCKQLQPEEGLLDTGVRVKNNVCVFD